MYYLQIIYPETIQSISMSVTDGCEIYWDRINNKISGIYVDLEK